MMNRSSKTAKANSPLRRRGVWLGLAVVLAGSLGLARLTLGRDAAPQAKKEAPPPSVLSAVQMSFRGPDQAMVGQRSTLEVFILNLGTTPLKDLELQARLDAHLELESREREHKVAVEPIAPDDLGIVRLTFTPRKNGPGGIDITLRAKNGETEQVRHVLPVVPDDPAGRQAPRVEGPTPLQFKITPLKDCFAGRPGIFLINVLNTDSKAMEKPLDLVVAYATPGRTNAAVPNPVHPHAFDKAGFGGEGKMMMGRGVALTSSTPIRKTQVTLPALGAGESRTLPVRITPRRIGELQIAVSIPPTAKVAPSAVLGTARLPVKFDPTAPVANLVPVPKSAGVPTRLPVNLTDVPEVSLEDPAAKGLPPDEAFEHIAHLIEKINHVNTAKMDAFVEAMITRRADVNGLPFVMGDACRLPKERGQHFLTELSTLRSAMGNPAAMASHLPNPTGQPNVEAVIQSRVAAMVQVVGPEGTQLGQEMVKYLATTSHVDATRALAKLAIFSEEEQVRKDAVVALAVRRDKDYSDILLGGLNYPWPAVAERTADAIVKLKRTDLVPKLVDALDRPDPRAPQVGEKDGKKVPVVRELVRINHFRNCLLCHSPATPAEVAKTLGLQETAAVDDVSAVRKGGRGPRLQLGLTAPVPVPGQQIPTPTPSGGYGNFSIPDILVNFDVTYLRQDFSVKLSVPNAQPWPEQQRFDFLVRVREITDEEAQVYHKLLRPADGGLSPYQNAALASLRQLTGKDAEPTAGAWRRLLAQNKTEK